MDNWKMSYEKGEGDSDIFMHNKLATLTIFLGSTVQGRAFCTI